MANNEIITKSGKRPDEAALPFTVTTSDVQSYLQKKVDVIVAGMVSSGTHQGHVDVKIYTTEAGTRFLPFAVALPTSVLEGYEKKNYNSGELDIFNPKDEDRSARVKKPIYDIFAAYGYNKQDGEAFMSDEWRRLRGVNRDGSYILKTLRLPRLSTFDNGRMSVVTFIIDPLRVFHDMLEIQDSNVGNKDFLIEIVSWKKIKTGEYQYKVRRVIRGSDGGKKKKYQNTYINELNHKMRGSR